MLNKLKNQRGMSLIEILVVLGIVSFVVAGIVSAVNKGSDTARKDLASSEISKMKTYLKMYKAKNSAYPTTDEGLEALSDYYDETPIDPWGNAYEYESPGTHNKNFDIWSKGPEDDDDSDDINSWELGKKKNEE